MSIFVMEHVNAVCSMCPAEARQLIIEIIDGNKTAKESTKLAAKRQILRYDTNSQKMAMVMSNWILAHPNENLKVIG